MRDLANAYRKLGDLHAAADILARAIPVSQAIGARWEEWLLWSSMADLFSEDRDETSAWYCRVLAVLVGPTTRALDAAQQSKFIADSYGIELAVATGLVNEIRAICEKDDHRIFARVLLKRWLGEIIPERAQVEGDRPEGVI
jgi:hypothetical protein